MSKSTKGVSIYLSENDKIVSRNSQSDSSTAYILRSHDNMLESYTKMKSELEAVNGEKFILEEENERMEKSLSNLKGFVKNLAIMRRLNSELLKKYIKYQNDTKNLLMEQYEITASVVYDNVMELILILVIYLFLYYFGLVRFIEMVLFIVLKGSFNLVKWTIYTRQLPYIKMAFKCIDIVDTKLYIIEQKNKQYINDRMTELKEIEKANEFLTDPLNELIDLQ
jgi:hypothetical protein